MFQFRRFPSYTYVFSVWWQDLTLAGLLHSDTHGSQSTYDSPWLFAVSCVLHRLLVPRHSPCALCSLTINSILLFLTVRSNQFASQIGCMMWYQSVLLFLLYIAISHFRFWNCSNYLFIFNYSLTTLRYLQTFSLYLLSLFSFQGAFAISRLLGGLKWTRTTDLTLIRRAL